MINLNISLKEYVALSKLTIEMLMIHFAINNVTRCWLASDLLIGEHPKTGESLFVRFNVNARLFKGLVIIGLNRLNLFDVFLVDGSGITGKINNIEIEDLVDTIDEKINKG